MDYFYLSFSSETTLVVDVTAQWERKCKALLSHKSQVGEDVIGFIQGFSNEMGKRIGVETRRSLPRGHPESPPS